MSRRSRVATGDNEIRAGRCEATTRANARAYHHRTIRLYVRSSYRRERGAGPPGLRLVQSRQGVNNGNVKIRLKATLDFTSFRTRVSAPPALRAGRGAPRPPRAPAAPVSFPFGIWTNTENAPGEAVVSWWSTVPADCRKRPGGYLSHCADRDTRHSSYLIIKILSEPSSMMRPITQVKKSALSKTCTNPTQCWTISEPQSMTRQINSHCIR